jgi:hypothetical protein
MSSLAEFIAAIMLWLSSMALCQFGMAVEHQAKAPPKAERVIARTLVNRLSRPSSAVPRLHTAEVSA